MVVADVGWHQPAVPVGEAISPGSATIEKDLAYQQGQAFWQEQNDRQSQEQVEIA